MNVIINKILNEISNAKDSIYIVIDNINLSHIYKEIINKIKNGGLVSIILKNENSNHDSIVDLNQLNTEKSWVHKIKNKVNELDHKSYLVIDNNTVITLTNESRFNPETYINTIVINRNDRILAEKYITEYHNILKMYCHHINNEENKLKLSQIIKRLDILKNYILLEDFEEINKAVLKIKEYYIDTELNSIIEKVESREYLEAIQNIENFISKNQQLTIWIDPEIEVLKIEIKYLETELNDYDNEKIELEKLLSNFQHRHSVELGEIILEILLLRKLKYQSNKTEFEEAENDEKQYREHFNSEKKKEVFTLTNEQKTELKNKFRMASVLCHPDKVADEFHDSAQHIFIDLKIAYDTNDLTRVNQILTELQIGNFYKLKSETVKEKDFLKIAIKKLKMQIKVIQKEIIAIKDSVTYKTIISIEDWDIYFKKTKEQMQRELDAIQKELLAPNNDSGRNEV